MQACEPVRCQWRQKIRSLRATSLGRANPRRLSLGSRVLTSSKLVFGWTTDSVVGGSADEAFLDLEHDVGRLDSPRSAPPIQKPSGFHCTIEFNASGTWTRRDNIGTIAPLIERRTSLASTGHARGKADAAPDPASAPTSRRKDHTREGRTCASRVVMNLSYRPTSPAFRNNRRTATAAFGLISSRSRGRPAHRCQPLPQLVSRG